MERLNEIIEKLDALTAENAAVRETLERVEAQKHADTEKMAIRLQRLETLKQAETDEIVSKLRSIEAVIARLGIVALDAVGALVDPVAALAEIASRAGEEGAVAKEAKD